ncbi:MAG: hypothetical protein WC071_06775 [Victivallaceae bacterium]
MIDCKAAEAALKNNLHWFINSGVMNPPDGSWGVAERIVVTKDNAAWEKTYTSFPAWTDFDGYSILEQRRADCNFETALLFLLASETFNNSHYREIAENILDFLYFKSGLLSRFASKHPIGAWNWSHIKWEPTIWFDDNGWNCAIQLAIGERYPDLDKKYQLKMWALKLADGLVEGFKRTFKRPHSNDQDNWHDPENVWRGRLNLPHWGSLVCMALSMAHKHNPKPEYVETICKYHEYLWENRDSFIVSEEAYALLGATFAATFLDAPLHRKLVDYFGKKLIAKMDQTTGNIPAEHFEAPTGPHLADMIYTVNWSLLSLQTVAKMTGETKYRDAFEKLLKMTLNIQDLTPELQFHGCWRGMYDLQAKKWGGGNCYEGGAASIYTGWTNAPVAWVLALELLEKSLTEL